MSMILAPEEWRPVLGYEGSYEVSDKGRVRSLTRQVGGIAGSLRRISGTVLKTRLSTHGYPRIDLSLNSSGRNVELHVLVCEAWHGPRPEGMVVRHLDDVKTNLDPDNLRWGTPAENARDAVTNLRNHNTLKTHCANGHEYTLANVYKNAQNLRACRQCSLVRLHVRKGFPCSHSKLCDSISHTQPNSRAKRRRTKCPRGHSMSDAYESPKGDRQCRPCMKEREAHRVQVRKLDPRRYS